MLLQQQTLAFSDYSSLYEVVVPKTNLLRRINELIDFSFVYHELSTKYCTTNGRVAESPVKMFKYLLLKTIYTLSDVDVVERSRYDMSFKYFLEMTPEQPVINPSSLTKFRKLRLKDTDLLNLLINKTVTVAVEKGIIQSKSIIVDSTHTLSRSNPFSPIELLRARSKQLRKAVYAYNEDFKAGMPQKNQDQDLDNELAYCTELEHYISQEQTLCHIPAIKEKLNLLKETLQDIHEDIASVKDSDAKIGHKSADSSFLGYKAHLAMTPERIITAAVVTSAEKADGPEFPELVEQTQDNGVDVDTVIGDTAYSGKDNLELAKAQDIQIVAKLNPTISQGRRKGDQAFEFNKDAGMFVCPAGHLAIRKVRYIRKNEWKNGSESYYFDVEKCKRCPFREGCYKPGAKTKSYNITIKSQTHLEQMAFEQSEEFKQKAKERYKIEAKNAELKNVHGLKRAQSYGIESMKMQAAIAIFTVNLKRIIKLG